MGCFSVAVFSAVHTDISPGYLITQILTKLQTLAFSNWKVKRAQHLQILQNYLISGILCAKPNDYYIL